MTAAALRAASASRRISIAREALGIARAFAIGDVKAAKGACVGTSHALAGALAERGFAARVAYGRYQPRWWMRALGHDDYVCFAPGHGFKHSWVVIGDVILDPTHRQFGGKPALKVTHVANRAYELHYYRDEAPDALPIVYARMPDVRGVGQRAI